MDPPPEATRTFFDSDIPLLSDSQSLDDPYPSQHFWLDATIGLDTNDGSFEAPFATIGALARYSFGANASSFVVQMSPGTYPSPAFPFQEGASWTFERCRRCPTQAKGEVILLATDPNNSLFSSDGLGTDSYEPELTLRGLTIAPGWPSSTPPINVTVLDLSSPNGILIDSCDIYGFSFFPAKAFSPSFARTPELSIRDTQIHDFQGHYRASVRRLAAGTGILGIVKSLTLERVHVFNNFVHFRYVYGGLFCSVDVSIHNSTFEHNRGFSEQGYGLLLSWIEGNHGAIGVVENSVFFNNSFLPHIVPYGAPKAPSPTASPSTDTPSAPSASLISNASTSGCVFYASNIRGLRLSITNSQFRRNTASSGVVLSSQSMPAISLFYLSFGYADDPLYVTFDASTFEYNEAAIHGVGAVLSISAGGSLDAIESYAASHSVLNMTNSNFIGNRAPTVATRPIVSPVPPATGIVANDPTLLDVHFVGNVFLSNLTMTPRPFITPNDTSTPSNGTTTYKDSETDGLSAADHKRSAFPAILQEQLASVTRIFIRYSTSLIVKDIFANGITPCWGTGGLLLVLSVPEVTVTNVFIDPPARSIYTDPTLAPTLGYDLIRIYRPEESPISSRYVTKVSNLVLSGWSTPVPTSFLSVDGVHGLTLTDIHMSNIASSSYVPLITLMGIQGYASIYNSSFINITSLMLIEAAPSNLLIQNVSLIDYANSVIPAIHCQAAMEVEVHQFYAVASFAPALAFVDVDHASIKVTASRFRTISAVDSVSGLGGGAFVFRSTSVWELTSTLTFIDCVFLFNTANSGAAIFVSSKAHVTIYNSLFEGNEARNGDGGAIFIQKAFSATLEVRDSQFDYNSAINGGAIAVTNALVVQNCSFQNNVASSFGGAIAFPDGPIMIEGRLAQNDIRTSNFSDNRAQDNGGAIGGVGVRGTMLVTSCNFINNVATGSNSAIAIGSLLSHGGAIATIQDLTVRGSTFKDNLAASGGALFIALHPNSTGITGLHASKFFKNSGIFLGGAITVSSNATDLKLWRTNISDVLFDRNLVAYRGGAISFLGSYPDFQNATKLTFTANTAVRGAAIYIQQAPVPVHLGHSLFSSNNASCCGAVIFYGNITSLYAIGTGTTAISGLDLPPDPLLLLPTAPNAPSVDDPEILTNFASWGVDQATSSLDLFASIVRGAIPYPDHEIPDPTSSKPHKIYVTYPGAVRSLRISGTDQFGQTAVGVAGALSFSYRFTCTSSDTDCAKISFSVSQEVTGPSWSRMTASAAQTLSVAQISFHMKPGHSAKLPSIITGVIEVEARWDSISADSSAQESQLMPTHAHIVIQSCGMGYGETSATSSPDRRASSRKRSSSDSRSSSETTTYTCAVCPLYYYSFNGTCARCAYDPGVQSCSGADIISPGTWWIMKDVVANRYQSLRCAESYCGHGNECLLGRTGTMCGECVTGRHQSITSICIDCNGPNWGMISLVFAGLWIAVLVLHYLLAVSSGKATIMIFFVQTAWTIRFQIPVVSTSVAGLLSTRPSLYRFTSWILCLWPMNYLSRTILIASIPFIMMFQIALTFALYHAFIRIRALIIGSETGYGKLDTSSLPYDAVEPLLEDSDDETEDDLGPSNRHLSLFRTVSNNDLDGESDLSDFEVDRYDAATTSASDTDGLMIDFDPNVEPALELDPPDVSNQLREANIYQDTYQYRVQNGYFHHYRLIRTVLSLYAGTFSSTLGIVMSTLGCIKLMDGQRVLAAAPSVSCSSEQFRTVRTLYAVLLPWLVIVMGTMAAKLIHGYRKNALSTTDVRFGVWYEMYKPRFFGWKLSELVRRTLVSIISNLLISEPSLRASMMCLLMLLSLTAQLIVRPYRHRLQNSLEILSLCSLTLISLCVLWYVRQQPETSIPSTISLALLIGTSVILVASFGSSRIIQWFRNRKSKAAS